MVEKSISGKKIANAITSEDILGKEVIDSEGGFIGIVEKLYIDSKSLEFTAIAVDKGLIRSGLTIGKNYIQKITPHAIFLKIRVVFDLKGTLVFDNTGKKIGKVSSLDLYGNKNKIKAIYVKTSSFSLFSKKEIVIPSEDIQTMGDNIILKVSLHQLQRTNASNKQDSKNKR